MSVSRLVLLTMCLALGACDAVRPSYRLLAGKCGGLFYVEGRSYPFGQSPSSMQLDVVPAPRGKGATGTWQIMHDGISSTGELTLKDDGVRVEGTLINRQCRGLASAHFTGGYAGRRRVSLRSAGFISHNPECRTGSFSALIYQSH